MGTSTLVERFRRLSSHKTDSKAALIHNKANLLSISLLRRTTISSSSSYLSWSQSCQVVWWQGAPIAQRSNCSNLKPTIQKFPGLYTYTQTFLSWSGTCKIITTKKHPRWKWGLLIWLCMIYIACRWEEMTPFRIIRPCCFENSWELYSELCSFILVKTYFQLL